MSHKILIISIIFPELTLDLEVSVGDYGEEDVDKSLVL